MTTRLGACSRGKLLLVFLLCGGGVCVGGVCGGCDDQSVGGARDDGGVQEDADRDGSASCDPGPMDLDCVTIEFPPQPTTFTQAELADGVSFEWRLVVPQTVDEVYPDNPDPNCCPVGVGPLRAMEKVEGNSQYYCDCDHGLCEPSGCETPAAMALEAGSTTQTFVWPGVNWTGPSDTNEPYGPAFLRGTYTVRVQAIGQWRPPGESLLKSYWISGEMEIEVVDGCGGRPAMEEAMWQCGGAGEGGFCLEITVDNDGQPVSWEPQNPVDPTMNACLEKALLDDCYPSLAGETEQVCIYGP